MIGNPATTLSGGLYTALTRSPEAGVAVAAGERWTGRDLLQASAGWADRLADGGVDRGHRVGLLVEPGLEALAALLAVASLGAAWVPLDPALPDARLRTTVEDAGISTIIADPAQHGRAPAPHVLTLGDRPRAAPRPPVAGPEDVAYVIYTSGSTGQPKGSLIPQRCVAALLDGMAKILDFGPGERLLAQASWSFDMSVLDLLLPLWVGASVELVDRGTARSGPALRAALDRSEATFFEATPATLGLLVSTGWRPGPRVRVLSAGEPLPRALIAPLTEAGARLYNGYGTTEATVYSTIASITSDEGPIPVGRPIPGTTVEVLDEALKPVPEGELGELVAGGLGVGLGYLNRPDLSARAFVHDPATGGLRYRSGDLGRRLPDGQIECLGRRDRQIKIHGYRVELDEIEAALRAQPGVVDAAAAARGEGAARRIIAAVVPAPGQPEGWLAEVRRGLVERLPLWMVPARFARLPALPLTPAGKVHREALPEGGPRPTWLPPYEPPASPEEARITSAMADLLRVDGVGATDDLFAWGGSSLLATALAARLHAEGLALSAADVFAAPTPRALAARAAAAADPPLVPRRPDDRRPLGSAQRQLWFLQQLDPSAVQYNLNFEIDLRGPLDPSALRSALLALVERHEALRSRVALDPEGPVWIIEPVGRLPLPVMDLEDAEPEERGRLAQALFRRPFDLASGPLIRASLLRLGPERHQLLLCLHHVAADGWSMGVLVAELAALLRGERLGVTPLQPADVAIWQAARREIIQAQIILATAALRGAPARLTLPGEAPTAGPRSVDPRSVGPRSVDPRSVGPRSVDPRSVAGGAVPVRWSPEVVAAARRLAAEEGATLYAALLAAVSTVFVAETDQRDLVFGTFFANRVRAPLAGVVGHLADTAPLRVRAAGAGSFRALLRASRAAVVEASARSEAPLLDVVAAVSPSRRDDQPLLNAAVVLQPAEHRAQAGALEISLVEVDNGTSPFDLLVTVTEGRDGLVGALQHRLDRLADGRPLAARLMEALERGVAAPDAPLEVAPWPSWARDVVEAAGQRWVLVQGRPPGEAPLGETWIAALPLDDQGLPLLPPPPLPSPPPPRHRDSLSPPAPPPPPAAPAPTPGSGGPSLRQGPALQLPTDAPRTLPALLARAARGDRGLLTLGPGGPVHRRSWASLQEEARRVASGLLRHGVTPGRPVLLQLKAPHDLLLGLWGCFLAGAVAVPLAVPVEARGPAYDKLLGNHEDLGSPPVLSRGGHAHPTAETLDLGALEASAPGPLPEPDPDGLALLLQTSGSTGRPKAVMHTATTILSMLHAYTAALGLGPEDVYLNWLGLDHVAPLFMVHLSAALFGAEQVNLPTDAVLADPAFWLEAAHQTRATTTFCANFAFGLAAEAAARVPPGRWDLSRYRRIANGGELVSPETLRRFARALAPHGLPPDAMVPIWGMSETGSATLVAVGLGPQDLAPDAAFVTVGACIAGFSARIVDDEGRLLPEGAQGRLQVRGASVTPGYYGRPDANAASFTADGWFDTGDLAFIDAQGTTITGRAKDVLIVRGVHYPGHALEETVEGAAGVARSFAAAVAVREPGDETDRLLVVFSPERADPDSEEAARIAVEVRRALVARFGLAPTAVVPVARSGVPKTEIGKIQRAKIRKAWESGELKARAREVELRQDPDAAIPPWFFAPIWRPRAPSPTRGPALPVGVYGEDSAADALAAALSAHVPTRRLRAPQEARGLGVVVHLAPARSSDLDVSNGVLQDLRALQAVGLELGVDGAGALVSVCQRGAATSPEEPIDPETAARVGLLRTLGHERPGLRTRALDLDDASPERVAARLKRELWELDRDEPEVAWRGERRLVRRLAPVDLGSQSWVEPLPEGAAVVLAGGLGGVGERLTEALMRRFKARPLLIGRTPEAALSEPRRAALARLRGLGPVGYAAIPAGDEGALAAALYRHESYCNAVIHTMFHLAATLRPTPLVDLDAAGWAEALAGPVELGRSLARAAEARGAGLVAVSTVNGLFGGFAAGPYAAGARFLEALLHEHRRRGLPARWLGFTPWRGVGISAEGLGAEAAAARGYRSMAPGQAVSSTLAALGRSSSDLAIGLDPSRLPLRRFIEGADPSLPPAEVSAARAPSEAPSSALERQVAAIWVDLLGRDAVGLNDNFFELGGHSILLAQLSQRLEAALSRPVPVALLFQRPTIRSLVEHLGGQAPDSAAAAKDRAARQRAALGAVRGARRDG